MAPTTKPKGGFYAVRIGKVPGIYQSWVACEMQIKGFPGVKYKKFSTQSEAEAYMSGIETKPSSSTEASSSMATSSKKRDFGKEVEDVTGWDVVYSDGACKGNGKAGSYAGVGVWWGHNDPRNIAERCPGDQTNNRAELIAILRVLESTPRTKKPLLIRTDSQYSIQCFKSWIFNWDKRGWKSASGEPVKNPGIIRCISAHLDIRGKMGQKVVLEYVKGHSGDVGNDGADLMANRGALEPQVDERPWVEIEQDLKQKLLEINTDAHTPVAQLTVLASDNLAEAEAEMTGAPAKVRKISPLKATTLKMKPLSQTKVSSVESPLKARAHSTLATNQESIPSTTTSLPIHTNKAIHSSVPSINATKAQITSPSAHTKLTSKTSDTSNPSPSRPNPSPTTNTISSYPHLSGTRSPMRVLCVRPPLVPVDVGDVNFDDYADCLLDDPSNDLSN